MLRSIVRAVLPISLRERVYRVRKAWDERTPMILAPTYAEDGLISQHVVDFMRDPKFNAAYEGARAGVEWTHPGEIKFRAYIACWAAEQALGLDGDFVECGVGHGIISGTVCAFTDFSKSARRFFLYDTFRGVPIETLSDPAEIAALQTFNQTHYSNDLFPQAKARFARYPNVLVIQGIVPDSLKGTPPDKIAYLSIDMNNATAEIGAIEYLWPRMVSGGIVLLDDYAYGPEFMGQKRAWDEFAKTSGFPILSLPTGQGLIIKR